MECRKSRLVEFEGVKERYDACLVLLGERTEQVEELKEDIRESKEAYREQLESLLAQINSKK
jgi:hypothetical protein